MANKYSRYELTPYVTPYVNDQSVQINQLLRQRYDQNIASEDLLDSSVDIIDSDCPVSFIAFSKLLAWAVNIISGLFLVSPASTQLQNKNKAIINIILLISGDILQWLWGRFNNAL